LECLRKSLHQAVFYRVCVRIAPGARFQQLRTSQTRRKLLP
jgi:hypothetical protein